MREIKPPVDVMMTVRNGEHTIESAVRSTLRAAGRYSRVLVWDDGSEDNTRGIVLALGREDSRVVLYSSEDSVGTGVGLQNLSRECRADIVARMDADDISLPWRFLGAEQALEVNDVVFGLPIRFSSVGKSVRPARPFRISSNDAPALLLIKNWFLHPSMFARREALQSVGGYSSMRRAQDYELWLRMAAAGLRLTQRPVHSIMYRQSATQTTRSSGFREMVMKQPEIALSYTVLLEALAAKRRIQARPQETPSSFARTVARTEVNSMSNSALKRKATVGMSEPDSFMVADAQGMGAP